MLGVAERNKGSFVPSPAPFPHFPQPGIPPNFLNHPALMYPICALAAANEIKACADFGLDL